MSANSNKNQPTRLVTVDYLGNYQERSGLPHSRVFVHGERTMMAHFIDIAEGNAFWADAEVGIRQTMADLHAMRENQRWSVARFKRELVPWLERVRAFIDRWGASMVPTDVRAAVNDVERNVNVPVTEWPAVFSLPMRM